MDPEMSYDFSESSRNTLITTTVIGKSLAVYLICCNEPSTLLKFNEAKANSLSRWYLRRCSTHICLLQTSERRYLRTDITCATKGPHSTAYTYTDAGKVLEASNLPRYRLLYSLIKARFNHKFPASSAAQHMCAYWPPQTPTYQKRLAGS